MNVTDGYQSKGEDMACACVSCGECGGIGRVWWSFGGREYLGNNRCDDLDELETCMACSGRGVVDGPCDECQDAMDMDDEDY